MADIDYRITNRKGEYIGNGYGPTQAHALAWLLRSCGVNVTANEVSELVFADPAEAGAFGGIHSYHFALDMPRSVFARHAAGISAFDIDWDNGKITTRSPYGELAAGLVKGRAWDDPSAVQVRESILAQLLTPCPYPRGWRWAGCEGLR